MERGNRQLMAPKDPGEKTPGLRLVEGFSGDFEPAPGLFTKFYRVMEARGGPVAVRAIHDFVNGKCSLEEVDERVERAPDFRQFQEKGLELLELYGIVRGEGKNIIVDLEKIKHFRNAALEVRLSEKDTPRYREGVLNDYVNQDNKKKQHAKQIIREMKERFDVYTDSGDTYTFLWNTFYGRDVFESQSYDDAHNTSQHSTVLPQAKPLFYTPGNVDTAFDPDSIRAEEFHMGPWELQLSKVPKAYSPFHIEMPYDEVSIAADMYHPLYGGAERENGVLYVNSSSGDAHKRQRISQNWLSGRNIGGKAFEQNAKKNSLRYSPRQYIESGGVPFLIKNDLLRPEDFESMSANESMKVEFKKNLPHKKGMVVLEDGIRYTLGERYGGDTHMIFKISDEMYGIVEKDSDGKPGEMVAVLDRVFADTELVKTSAQSDKVRSISFKDLKTLKALRAYDPKNPDVFLPRKKDETDDAYAARASEVVGFADFLKLKKEIQASSQVSLDALSPHEQTMVLSFFQHVEDDEKDKVFDFIKTYGIDGARCFAACAHDSDAGTKLLTIMDTGRSRADVIPVLRKYLEVSDSSAEVETDIQSFFVDNAHANSVDGTQVTGAVMKRALRVLTEYADGRGAGLTYNEIEKHFNSLKRDMIIFGSIFKAYCTAQKGHVDMDLIRGLSVTSSSPAELTPKQIQDMRAMYTENRQSLSNDVAEVMTSREFDTHMASHESKMYILQKEGEIFSYALIEPIDETTVYAGLFNTHQVVQGDSIGWIFAKEVIKTVGSDKNIVMKTRVDNPALGLYKDKLGFQENSEMYEDPHTHMFYMDMIRYASPESDS